MSLFLDGSESFYAVRKCAEMSLMHLLYLVVMWSRACPFSVLKTLHETASRRGFHTQLTKIPSQKNIQRSESPVRDFHKLLTCEPREVTEAPAEKGQQTRSVPDSIPQTMNGCSSPSWQTLKPTTCLSSSWP